MASKQDRRVGQQIELLTMDSLARRSRMIIETAATPTRAVASTWAAALLCRSTSPAASHPSGFGIGPSSVKPPGCVPGSSSDQPLSYCKLC